MAERDRVQKVLGQLFNLATALHEKHYPENTHWTPAFGDMTELILQIDNMTAGLVRAPTLQAENTALAARVAELETALKAFRKAKAYLSADDYDDGPEMRAKFDHADSIAIAALSKAESEAS